MALKGLDRLRENSPLREMTTLGVGGNARFFLQVEQVSQLSACTGMEEEVLVLGGGSNLLVSDTGFDGVVIGMEIESLVRKVQGRGREDWIVGAGVDWDELVSESVAEGFGGLECLSGIPGKVGAAPIQNIGAYGQEVSDIIEWVEVWDLEEGISRRISADKCGFGYRSSHFKHEWFGRFIVTGVCFRLVKGAAPNLTYGEVMRSFEDQSPGLAEVRGRILEIRGRKSMLVDRADPNGQSAGSFFINPVVTLEESYRIRERGRIECGEEMPLYPVSNGRMKLSAGWLIERAGFKKGTQRGRAAISTAHCLALVNLGGATAKEILALAIEIRERVFEVYGVGLTPEVRLVGFERESLTRLMGNGSSG